MEARIDSPNDYLDFAITASKPKDFYMIHIPIGAVPTTCARIVPGSRKKLAVAIRAAAILCAVGLAVSTIDAATLAPPSSLLNPQSSPLTPAEQRCVDAINAYRAKHKLPPLVVDPTLMRIAREAAPHFSHTISGRWCWDRARAAGFAGFATDNIADGYESPEAAVGGWATSDGHARQMRGQRKLNGRWEVFGANRVGVGIVGRKYCAVFGRAEAVKTQN
jgi:uncharacterized protein YkwD